jgi:hypothetical protein
MARSPSTSIAIASPKRLPAGGTQTARTSGFAELATKGPRLPGPARLGRTGMSARVGTTRHSYSSADLVRRWPTRCGWSLRRMSRSGGAGVFCVPESLSWTRRGPEKSLRAARRDELRQPRGRDALSEAAQGKARARATSGATRPKTSTSGRPRPRERGGALSMLIVLCCKETCGHGDFAYLRACN